MFVVAVEKSFASCLATERLTVGMVGAQVSIRYSQEWDELIKVVLFSDGVVERGLHNPPNIFSIPREVLTTKYRGVRIGVSGLSQDGTVAIPTIWTKLGTVLPSVENSGGEETGDITPPLWQQAIAKSQEALDAANTVLKAYENGELVGPPGPQGEKGEKGDKGDPGGGAGGVSFQTDETLILENGVLSVNTADAVEEDNTLPISSAGVFVEVGNINKLLSLI